MQLIELIEDTCPDEIGAQSFSYVPHNWREYSSVPMLLGEAGYSSVDIANGFSLSRKQLIEVFCQAVSASSILLTAIWGYPKGRMPGGSRKPLQAILDHGAEIASKILSVKASDSAEHILKILSYPHVGVSTLSKILYFSGLACAEGRFLIYDQMVMRALNHHGFKEFPDWPAYSASRQLLTYAVFLDKANRYADKFGCSPEHIEYALFLEGRRLPPAKKLRIDQSLVLSSTVPVVAASGFTQERTWAREATFYYRIGKGGSVLLRYGSEGGITIPQSTLVALSTHFSGKLIPLTSSHGESLDGWLIENFSRTRLASYIGPLLTILGFARRQDLALQFD